MKIKNEVYTLHCSCCNEPTITAFEPWPDDLPPNYCCECTLFITSFATKYGIKTYDVTKTKLGFGGDRPGTMSYHAKIKFLTSDDYENNNSIPLTQATLATPIIKHK